MLISPEVAWKNVYDLCLKNPPFSWVSPSIYVSSICHSSGSKVPFLVLSLFYRFIALLLRSNILPSSNHPLQLPVTRQARAVYMCDAYINKLACLPVVKLLFCQVPNNETDMGRGKRTIFVPPLQHQPPSVVTNHPEPHKDVSLIHKLLKQAFTLAWSEENGKMELGVTILLRFKCTETQGYGRITSCHQRKGCWQTRHSCCAFISFYRFPAEAKRKRPLYLRHEQYRLPTAQLQAHRSLRKCGPKGVSLHLIIRPASTSQQIYDRKQVKWENRHTETSWHSRTEDAATWLRLFNRCRQTKQARQHKQDDRKSILDLRRLRLHNPRCNAG